MKPLQTVWMTLIALALTTQAFAGGEGWVTDFEAAKATAKADSKYMLVDFTGSDWCGWCIKLKKEVFSTDYFKAEAPKQFVLVELDYPRDKSKMSEELLAQNDKLKGVYKISGYPTILLMDADGKVFAKTGYQAGGPEKYIEHLNGLVESKKTFDNAIAKANKAKGLERAKLLDKALSALDDTLRRGHKDLAKEICTLDKDNKAGLKAKYEFMGALDDFDALPRNVAPPQRLEKLAEIEKKFKPEGLNLQKLLSRKAMFTFYTGDLEACQTILDQAIAIDPKSNDAKNMARSREFVVKQIEQKKKKEQATP